jgi:hypothetical protein
MATSHPPLRRPGAASMLLAMSLLASTAAAQEAAATAAAHDGAGGVTAAGARPPGRSAPAAKADDAPAPPVSPTEGEPAWQRQPAARRGGFTVGLAAGLSLGSAAGYPNDIQKIGFERYYTETGVGVGAGGYLWLGGALADWFTFGVGFGGSSLTAGKYATSMGGVVFHTEVFPLFSLGGAWREAGIILDAGTGGATTTSEDTGDTKIIDGALPAKIGGGVFYEGIRFWKVSTGPWLYADYTWSGSVRQPGVYLGWRTALYTKP